MQNNCILIDLINKKDTKNKIIDIDLLKSYLNKFYKIDNNVFMYIDLILNLEELVEKSNTIYLYYYNVLYKGLIFNIGKYKEYNNFQCSQFGQISIPILLDNNLTVEIDKKEYLKKVKEYKKVQSSINKLIKGLQENL